MLNNYVFKTQRVGVIGGMSHETSDHYVAEIHRLVQEHLGGLHSAQLVHFDVDFDYIHACMKAGAWEEIADTLHRLAWACASQQVAGIAFASNTIHKAVALLCHQVDSGQVYVNGIPLIHIGDSVIRELHKDAKRLLLLGTKFTMTEDFMASHYRERGYEVVVPDAEDCARLDDIIFNELCKGIERPDSQHWLEEMIVRTILRQPVDAVILGCTELPMLIDPEFGQYLTSRLNYARSVAIIDSAAAHIRQIAEWCVKPEFR